VFEEFHNDPGGAAGERAIGAPGKVWLIGAGPGDPELLALKAVRALGQADVVLLDELVNREILVHSPRARVIEVGKRGGCRSTSQAYIVRLMLRLARAGKTVARLKGGDPFVFGRGGEELLALREAGIRHEVISGITSGIAVPAALGIPVTHRDHSHGVSFVTGHSCEGGGVNWEALARSGTTIVIYMGVANIASIASRLIAAGLTAETPACAIQHGTLPSQKQVLVNLGALAQAMRDAALASPAIVIIGDVVSLTAVGLRPLALRRAA